MRPTAVRGDEASGAVSEAPIGQHVYTYLSKKALAAMKTKVRRLTTRSPPIPPRALLFAGTREFMAMQAIAVHFGRPGTPTEQGAG